MNSEIDESGLCVKQKYLRDNILEEQYQQFGQFCIKNVGNSQIGSWSIQFVKQLVSQFNQTKARQVEQPNHHQTIFHIYQTADPNQVKKISQNIRQEHNQFIQLPLHPQILLKQNKEPINGISTQNRQITLPENSAVGLLQQVFQKVEKEEKEEQEEKVDQKQHSPAANTLKAEQTLKIENRPSSIFDSHNFWAVPESSNNFKQTQQNKSESLQTFKYLEDSFYNEYICSKVKENENEKVSKNTKIQNQKNPKHLTPETENGKIEQTPSPHLKKSQVQLVESRNKSHTIIIKEIRDLNTAQLSEMERKICNKVIYQGNTVFKEKFQDSVPCFKSSTRVALSHPNLSISIEKHEIVERSFFAPDYVMYTLKVLPTNIQCKRNYEDFTKLRDSFMRVYPAIHLPYLEQNSWLTETNADSIKKQKLMLQYFLEDVLYNKQLKNSQILQDFLSLPQHKKMKRKFQEYDKMEKLPGVEQLCLLQGKVDVKISQEQRIYQQKAQRFIYRMEDLLERHKRLTETLSNQYEYLLGTLAGLSQLMKESEQEVKNFNDRVPIHEVEKLCQIFQSMNSMYNQKHSQNKFEWEILNKNILPLMKYQKQNLQTLKKLLQISKDTTRRYLKRTQTQSISTNLPYLSDKLKKFKSGILQQSKDIFVFKYQVGFINNQACVEFQRFFQLMAMKLAKKWSNIAQKTIQRQTQSIEFWSTKII